MIDSSLSEPRRSVFLLICVGNTLTIAGLLCFIGGLAGFIPVAAFALGLSSGVRIIAMVAITGCLLSATGYGLQDYFKL